VKTKLKQLPLKEFNRVYGKVPRLCVDLVVKTKNGVILSKRDIKPSKGMWHIPGGTVLFGEKLSEAISRVAEEELGLKLEIIKLLGTTEFLPPTSPHAHAVSIAFLTKPIAGKLRGSSQGREVRYFKQAPLNTIKEQEKFLTIHKFFKKS